MFATSGLEGFEYKHDWRGDGFELSAEEAREYLELDMGMHRVVDDEGGVCWGSQESVFSSMGVGR